MKKLLALLLISCMLMTTLASCDLFPTECTEHVDADGDYVCDNCEAELKKPDPKPPVCEEHKDEDGDEKCDACGADVPKPQPPACTEHKDEDGDEKCDDCGADVPKPQPPACTEHKDEDGDEKCDACGADVPKPQPPVCTEHKDEDGDYKCDACGYVMFEDVVYELNIGDLATGTRGEDEINGKFTIVSGSEVRNRTKSFEGIEYTKSVKIGNSTTQIKVSVPGTGKLYFLVQNGSSGAETQFIKVTAPDGTVQDIEFDGTNNGSPVVKIELDVTEGEWIISRGKNGGTQDIFYLNLSCTVATSPENGFELVSSGKVEYLVGEALDMSKLQLNATFENGKTDSLALENVTIDTSAVNMAVAGEYEVVVTYKDYDPIKYTVSVYAPESLELGLNAIEKLPQNSSAGNGVYYNYTWKLIYFIGEELDTKGLTVSVVAKCGEKTLKFVVDDYTITGFDSTTAGRQELTVASNGVSTTIYTSVVDEEYSIVDGVYQVRVSHSYDVENTGSGQIVDGYNTFVTIHQALEFLAKAEPSAKKVIEIDAGYYAEKLEITIPNLTIKGAGADVTIIEWDSLYGQVDEGGFTHTTDSTATVAVREQAINCVIEGVTISNYWNTQERLDEAGLAIERNLALLVQADRFIMKDSALLAIQDTLELFTGRQYFENVFISGYTDFIFGTNNTTYFKNCTIHVIDTSKDDAGTAGYLTAFKGSNKGASDSIVYGAIFDGCKFTADEGVMEGKTAIGRTWGAYAAVAVINSEIGAHISLDGYDKSENKNKRYISMNGIHPTDATVQFVEYNNTGAGAISEAVAGMKMLTAEEAALYADFATIFGTINGNVSYLDPWDPKSDEIAVDDRDYYYFNGDSSATGDSHTFDTTTTIAKGGTLEWDGLLISAEKGNVAWNSNANALNMKAGAFIKFTVPAGTTVTVETYPNYNYFTLNGVGTSSANMLSQYYAEETEVTLLSTGDLYIYSIIINPNEEAPEAPTLNEIKVNGMVVDYLVGDEVSLEGVSVNAYYSDKSVRPVEYTVDTSAVNNAAAGEYTVVFTVGDKSINVTVTFVADFVISESTTIDLSATGAKIEGAIGDYKGLTIDATNGKFADNNGGWTQVNSGTVISFKVAGDAEVSVTAYSSADNFTIAVADGICTITATANDYLKAIAVKIIHIFKESTTIDLSATGGLKIEKAVGEYAGLSIDATNGKFADNGGGWVQVNAGTIITLNVAEGAAVTVSAYSSADNFTVAVANGVCTITCVGNDYLNAITISY